MDPPQKRPGESRSLSAVETTHPSGQILILCPQMNSMLIPRFVFLLCVLWIANTTWAQETPTQWKIFSLGNPALSINLPGDAIPMETPVSVEEINRIKRFDTYRLYHGDGKVVAVLKFMQFNKPIDEPLIQLMDTELDHIMISIKAEEILSTGKNIKVKQVPGYKLTGRFMLKQQPWLFQDFLLKKEDSMWQVWIAAEESDPAYEKTMLKIAKSVKFRDP